MGSPGGSIIRPTVPPSQAGFYLITIKPIMIGLGDFDYTQIVSGLDEGEVVVSIPLSLIQQQDFINRMRDRMSLPGIGRGR